MFFTIKNKNKNKNVFQKYLEYFLYSKYSKYLQLKSILPKSNTLPVLILLIMFNLLQKFVIMYTYTITVSE